MKVSTNGNASFKSDARPNRTSARTRSILLIASATDCPRGMRSRIEEMIALTPSVMPRCASTSSTMISASAAPPQAAATIARSNRRRGRNRPGVSTNTICADPAMQTPRIRARVVCTLWVTMLTLAPTILFSRVDFPAFGSPISATNPACVTGSVIPYPPTAATAAVPRPVQPPVSFRPPPRRCPIHPMSLPP